MQSFAAAAGTVKPVYYRIFPSRADVIKALFAHIRDAIARTQLGERDSDGWALCSLYLDARNDPAIFLAVLKLLRGHPAYQSLRDQLLSLVETKLARSFEASAGATPCPPDSAVRASRITASFLLDTLVVWLEDNGDLSDEKRSAWWNRIAREWRLATREAYALDPPQPETAAGARSVLGDR